MRAFAAGFLSLFLVTAARGGVYSPDEPFNFEIDSDGFARPIQFAGGFESIVAGVREIAILPQNPGDRTNPRRQEVEERVRQRKAKGVAALSPEELSGLTADLIRLNRADEVLNLLQPLARDPRRGGFLVYTHLARAHAARGEWREAYEQQQMAVRYSEFPTSFAKLTKPQLAWLKRVEREYYLPFLAHRAEEARGRPRDLREDVDPLFPAAVPPKRPENPVRFQGEGGAYAAGSIAAADKARLPPDALTIAQQLVLWHPQDARLYWQLGELFNADGDVEAAAKVLDHCSYNMGYSNPTLVRHRQILNESVAVASAKKAVEAEQARLAEAAEQERLAEERRRREDAERDYQKRFWWILAVGVALGVLLVYYQVREVVRRFRRAGKVA